MVKLKAFVPLVFASRQNGAARCVGNFDLLRVVGIVFVACSVTVIASHAQTSIPLFSFDGTNGATTNGIIQASDGNFYGTTSAGGANNYGTIFQITPEGALNTVYNFCSQPNCTDGYWPNGGLIRASDGNFYGTTGGGGSGSGGRGTVFEITAGGILTTLYSFCSQPNCTDGADPFAGLIQATNGNFYGTTAAGGMNGTGSTNSGTVFEITPGGTLTTLFSFDGTDGAWLTGKLVQGTDGNFYGTTWAGGTGSIEYGGGTVFKITPGGTLTTLYSFCSLPNCDDGIDPDELIQVTNGNFYGTTAYGGADDWGTVFEITSSGALTTLHTFAGPDGGGPGNLNQTTSGNFYGTTGLAGAHGHGTIFELTPAGTVTTLYEFCSQRYCVDGAFPSALVQAADGNFYGTTSVGGASASKSSQGAGTVFTFGPPTIAPLPTSLSLGNLALNETSAAVTVSLSNTSPILLEISIVITPGSFAISSNTCGATLAGGQRCKVSITFTPTILGKQTGTLTFTNNASNSPQIVALSGWGVAPATLTPLSFDYGKLAVGTTSAAKVFTLTNNQNVTLSNIAISTTGDFAISATTCTTSLAAKGECTISVTFTPTQTGARTGQLNVSDSASNSPQTSTLTGTGASD
jgi:uncharacterized repeat protein (TIGR03803 family)